MNKDKLLDQANAVPDDAKAAILNTITAGGNPVMTSFGADYIDDATAIGMTLQAVSVKHGASGLIGTEESG